MNKEKMAKYAIKKFIAHNQQSTSSHPQTPNQQPTPEQHPKKHWWSKAEAADAILTPQEREVLRRVKKRAVLLDKGMNCCCCQIGLDGIVGLIPVVGDGLGLLLALQVVHMAMAADIPSSLVSKMMLNIVFDFAIGVVPVVGDVLDIIFKANTKNAILLEDYLLKRRRGALNNPPSSNREALLPTHNEPSTQYASTSQ
ncbi:hypothetical protein [Parasitella parasitica]|uniref:DUF4112 domain-containing protein n=1 Tax=Parasitella parasitica TaxID=35722 RepID=A0A0B7MV72_9FUNG|nr:hypothetical protein [Parasitella parasitica]